MEIAGVIILFNPEDELLGNINSYINEVNVLYVIDNSEIYNIELYEKICTNDKVKYINNFENKGVAEALNKGAKIAIDEGYKWLLTMDQDSSFFDNAFFKIFTNITNKDNIAILSPSHIQTKSPGNDRVIPVDITMTSGNIINLTIFSILGGFNTKLFIDEVDHDYCFKAKLRGYDILQSSIMLKHKLGNTFNKDGKDISVHTNNRIYYITRNNLFIWRRYFFNFPKQIIKRIKWYFKYLILNIYYSKNRILTIKFFIKGLYHFFIGRYGKL